MTPQMHSGLNPDIHFASGVHEEILEACRAVWDTMQEVIGEGWVCKDCLPIPPVRSPFWISVPAINGKSPVVSEMASLNPNPKLGILIQQG